ncbi:hypothetical protein J7T55_000213 [Diaporthe amygdali]|uniref:uncharacterized protein n=1 Tax=Phomopsis amygdali TaxID=1214568 RepID=UPI0022FEE1F1|nr:uncharacterized protein J7T55_000213 [Diaporthe amygdali]KAJ0108247.1 hypothetical protein J7T55_000213 [Diaporthe amygdali]
MVESKRPRPGWVHPTDAILLGGSDQICLVDRSDGDKKLQCFLDMVHPLHPFLDKNELLAQYEETMSRGFDSGNQTALIMAILALGAISSDPIGHPSESRQGHLVSVELEHFNGAEAAQVTQALLLCVLYFNYAGDPLMAWRLVHMASTSIQQVLNRDLLAEFHQPRSGIELLVDKLPFPDYGESPGPENLYVLAEISARLLLNRIHHALFHADNLAVYAGAASEIPSFHRQRSTHSPNASLLRVCDELERQLQSWYDSLPEVIRPDISGTGNSESRHASVLELRYWSTKQNIYRNFVIYVTQGSSDIGNIMDSGTTSAAIQTFL